MSYRGLVVFWGSAEWAGICKICDRWGSVFGFSSKDRFWVEINLIYQGWRETQAGWICPSCMEREDVVIDLLVIQEGLGL